MDYRSRWYASSLGRFTQPDSIVPNPDNPQNLNRYAYASNNPINRIDPDGHAPKTPRDRDQRNKDIANKLKKYGIRIADLDNWKTSQLEITLAAVSIVDKRLRSVDSNFVSAFGTSQVGGTDITISVHDEAYSETPLADHGRRIYLQRKLSLGVVVHELGHAFDFIRNSAPSKTYEVENAGKHGYMRPFGFKQIEYITDPTGEYGLYDDPAYTSGFGVYWFSYPYKKTDDEGLWRANYQNSGEIFADLFVAWVFHYWPPLNRTDEHFRKNWMEGFMSDPSGWGTIEH